MFLPTLGLFLYTMMKKFQYVCIYFISNILNTDLYIFNCFYVKITFLNLLLTPLIVGDTLPQEKLL